MMDIRTPIITDVNVERNAEGSLYISWKSSDVVKEIKIFVGDSPDGIEIEAPVAKATDVNSALIPDLPQDTRFYFNVVADGGEGIIVSERRVELKGSINFRDLGGYENKYGRRVKWGEAFRADHLSRLTENDQTIISKMGIKTIYDFRTPQEVERQPNLLPEDNSIEYINLPIVHGEFDPAAAMKSMWKGDISWLTKDFMLVRYRKKIDDFAYVWGDYFNRLAKPENRPVVFHCTAGKDRTGACAALTLLALGVSEELVIYDFDLSNKYNEKVVDMLNEKVRELGINPDDVAPYFTAQREAIVSMIEHIRVTYGSTEDYLIKKAGVSKETLERIRHDLLE
ncbi:MAG: tyrosine-protein phosphatase [Gammaproteobacteria bacterium]|jgi:protein-tyrosine phosphatase|nr:tyrosine-protein phosphatase [Gammaproteobacteria bacterium]